MNELYRTIAAGALKANTNEAFAMLEGGPVVVLSKATPKAVLVSVNEWNRIARRLRLLETLVEAQHVEARNEADQRHCLHLENIENYRDLSTGACRTTWWFCGALREPMLCAYSF